MMNRSQQTFAGFAAACAFAAGSAAQAWAAPADAIVYPAGNGSDQADALQAALDALQTGQRLVLAPGQYVVGRSLLVKNAQVVVSGYGATLVATNDADQTIEMRGRDSTLVGVTLVGTGATRLTTPGSTKVDVTGAGVQVLDVEVRGGASAGIFVFGGTDVAVVGNTVRDTLADGIHTTYGSRNVLVRDNTVQNTGDDMVAVVSYKGDGKLSSNVLIQNNTLLGNYWGRGATVVGGADVTITGNTVRNVQKAAGILVGQEDPANTYDARNVIVSNNTISDIEWPDPDNTRPPAYMAAIDVNTWSGKATSVSVTDNRISRARYAGARQCLPTARVAQRARVDRRHADRVATGAELRGGPDRVRIEYAGRRRARVAGRLLGDGRPDDHRGERRAHAAGASVFAANGGAVRGEGGHRRVGRMSGRPPGIARRRWAARGMWRGGRPESALARLAGAGAVAVAVRAAVLVALGERDSRRVLARLPA